MHHSAPHQLITKSSSKSVGRLALLGSLIGLSVGLAACAEAPDPIPGTGGTASGGTAAGGGVSGGAASGGAASGGAASGGAASGGAASGGAASGGAASGGAASGGEGSGGETAAGGTGTGGDGATGGAGTGGAASTATFEDLTDTLTASCATTSMCHGAGTPRINFTNDAGLYGRLTTMNSARCANNKFVTASDSATSAIVMAMSGAGCTHSMGSATFIMPPSGDPVPADDIQTIKDWIDAGATE